MTSDRLFNALAAYLSPKVLAAGGVFSPSETVAETLALLAQSPMGWRCILQWQREDDTGARNENKLKVLLVVQQGQGLGVAKGASLTLTRPGSEPLLKRFNIVAGWVRAVQFTNPDVEKKPLQQLSAYWLHDPAIPTRQIGGEFAVCYGLDSVTLVDVTIP